MLPTLNLLCPYFQTAEDGAEALEHVLETHPDAAGFSVCSTCRRHVVMCLPCGHANRLLAKFCRNCGQSLPKLHWPQLGGCSEGELLSSPIGVPRSYSICPVPPLKTAALLSCGGVMVQVGKEDTARLMRGDRVLSTLSLPPGQSIISSCIVGGLLATGMKDRIAFADLIDSLEVSHGSPSRKKQIRLRGELAAPLTTDGSRVLVALTRDMGVLHLYVYQVQGPRLSLSWSLPLDEAPPNPSLLSISGQYLLHACESGLLEAYSIESGERLGRLQLPTNLAYLPPLPRALSQRAGWLVAGSDGSLFRAYYQSHTKSLESTPLAPACPERLFEFGADAQDVVMCHGRSLRRVDSVSGKIYDLELPQHCTVAPWVQKSRALAISQEGMLYSLSLGGSSFQVEHTLRLPGNFQGNTLAPLQLHGSLWLADTDGTLLEAKLS